jgi:hypothetical protein
VAWRVVVEDKLLGATVVDVHTRLEPALEQAKRIAKHARGIGSDRPEVHVTRTESSDQLQTYANGTKAVRDQPWRGAVGQHRILYAPCAEVHAKAIVPRSSL